MPRHFDFDLGPSGVIQEDPVTFSVKGTVNGEPWEEVFECLPALPVGVIADLGGWVISAGKGVAFVAGCLTPESEDRWEALVRDKARIVKDDDLAWIVRTLLTEYLGRPTQPSSGSPNGAVPIGTTSTGGSPSPG